MATLNVTDRNGPSCCGHLPTTSEYMCIKLVSVLVQFRPQAVTKVSMNLRKVFHCSFLEKILGVLQMSGNAVHQAFFGTFVQGFLPEGCDLRIVVLIPRLIALGITIYLKCVRLILHVILGSAKAVGIVVRALGDFIALRSVPLVVFVSTSGHVRTVHRQL